jgi:hypothetical protein
VEGVEAGCGVLIVGKVWLAPSWRQPSLASSSKPLGELYEQKGESAKQRNTIVIS